MDRTTKILLAALAAAFFLNAAAALRPVQAQQNDSLARIDQNIRAIAVMLVEIGNGTCENAVICRQSE